MCYLENFFSFQFLTWMIQNSAPGQKRLSTLDKLKQMQDINSSASKARIHFMTFSLPSLSCLRKLPIHVILAT